MMSFLAPESKSGFLIDSDDSMLLILSSSRSSEDASLSRLEFSIPAEVWSSVASCKKMKHVLDY